MMIAPDPSAAQPLLPGFIDAVPPAVEAPVEAMFAALLAGLPVVAAGEADQPPPETAPEELPDALLAEPLLIAPPVFPLPVNLPSIVPSVPVAAEGEQVLAIDVPAIHPFAQPPAPRHCEEGGSTPPDAAIQPPSLSSAQQPSAPLPSAPTLDGVAPLAMTMPTVSAPATQAPPPPAPIHTPAPPITNPAAALETVRLGITRQLAEGRETITIRLDPPEQGRVDIRLSFADGGKVEAVIASDNAALLDLMRRDAGELQRSFAEAGLRADAAALKFEASNHHPSGQQQHTAGHHQPRGQQPRQPHQQQHGTLTVALPANHLPPSAHPAERLNRII